MAILGKGGGCESGVKGLGLPDLGLGFDEALTIFIIIIIITIIIITSITTINIMIIITILISIIIIFIINSWRLSASALCCDRLLTITCEQQGWAQKASAILRRFRLF